MLKIYNTLTRAKETFVPINNNEVRMYVCGMTVYDYCHVGHARVLVVFDMIYRYLQSQGYRVTYIRNITDIDDKIIQRANENNMPMHELTERFIQAMHEDAGALGVLPPTFEPKATDNIDAIIKMIETLIAKDHAYKANNGDVYFSVKSFASYGQLSGKNIDDLQAGSRVAVDDFKQDPLDFVLWKAAKPDEPAWPSPWGQGRPGWHIECSAMSTEKLGNHFDIHGGGQDLQFPHHENEIAQSQACTGEKYVNYWIHNGFVRINEEKMSKSLGNFFTVRDVLKHIKPEVLRYFILASHYRSPLNYSEENLQSAHVALTRIYTALQDISAEPMPNSTFSEAYKNKFMAAMNDDFNTPEALAVIFELVSELNKTKTTHPEQAQAIAALILTLGQGLGLLNDNPKQFLQSSAQADGLNETDIEQLIQQRNQAKASKDWAESDRIRDVLKAQGVILKDTSTGTEWVRETALN